MKNFPADAFSGLENLKEIYLDEYIVCCYAENVVPGVRCISPKDEFSSCSDLMKNKGVQICVWILGLTALVGNLLVILLRVFVKEDNKVHSFLLTNLAISDLLMGVYLLIIAFKDVQWQGEYFKHDVNWRSGLTCAITGVLSMASSEISVLMLTLITTDRLICIVFPFKMRRINRKRSFIIVGGIWVFGTMISIIPTLGFDYFFDKKREVGFYGKSAVCLPLQLSKERQAGWEYAVGIFIILNFVSFMYILTAYTAMYLRVKGSAKQVRSTNMKRESKMAKRMMLIVLTDFLCWMPIIVIGLLSLLGKFHDPEKQAYVWIAVFVLPLNSALNPILYTFSTPLVKRKVGEHIDSLISFVERTVQRPKTTQAKGKGVPLKPLPTSNQNKSNCQPDEILERERPESELKLVEIPGIFADETSLSVGFVVACSGSEENSYVRLIKHFSKIKEENWKKEVELAKELRQGLEHPNIIKYCWHSATEKSVVNYKKAGEFPRFKKSSFLLCFDFSANTTLEEYLISDEIVLNLDSLIAVAMDLISAIQHLEQKGVVHNNIATSSVLIGKGFRVPPITAVLGSFGFAQRVSQDFPECFLNGRSVKDILGKNILQFGFVLKELMKNCRDSNEIEGLQQVMHLCIEQDPEVRLNACQVKDLVEELWYRYDIWDASL
ncbi:relaxin receptor 2-like [Porites lutea]